MDYYIVTKKVTLQAKGKEFFKDRIVTAEDVGSKNISRFLSKGYIKLLGDKPVEQNIDNENDYDYDYEDYLTAEQLGGMNKQELVEYAGRIGVSGYKSNIGVSALRELIIKFIDEADEDECEDDDSEENEDSAAH